ncbi:MAG: YdeI/OmpD-associated family protein [Bacteroidetes bacterium]|nr:YdeI/OmpD-associated family protein [Bacteroidota bacterium]
MHSFTAKIEIIGVNPFVFVPPDILQAIFTQAGKTKGHIPIKGAINLKEYKQTLVRYQGEWRLYINTTMLKDSPKRIGETVRLTIQFDPESREIKPPADFIQALNKNTAAQAVFDQLPPSRQTEIIRYIAKLKTEEARASNIQRAIRFLLGKERFIGRDKP